ncbi:histone-lysine N-methyltransferase eggless-like [Brevipalpus obovatus]|uniref:histone-lysine N-methyltransferase eggless-like n=1 Tax=Brevipalpus obovatus TaxID=246614 RepID=UPI003D9E3E58
MRNLTKLFTSFIDEYIHEKISLHGHQHGNLNGTSNIRKIDTALARLSNDFGQISCNLMDLQRIVSRTKDSLRRSQIKYSDNNSPFSVSPSHGSLDGETYSLSSDRFSAINERLSSEFITSDDSQASLNQRPWLANHLHQDPKSYPNHHVNSSNRVLLINDKACDKDSSFQKKRLKKLDDLSGSVSILSSSSSSSSSSSQSLDPLSTLDGNFKSISVNSSHSIQTVRLDEIIRRPKCLWKTREYYPHPCRSNCIPHVFDFMKVVRNEIPFAIPIIFGWQRAIISKSTSNESEFIDDISLSVLYNAPCGRRIRDLAELDHYLFLTNCPLTIDLFSFDTRLELFPATFGDVTSISCFYFDHDVSKGSEPQPVSVFNGIDCEKLADDFQYLPFRIEGPGVTIPKNFSFMVHCDCSDGCLNKLACKCQRLTIEASAIISEDERDLNAGYEYRRLNYLQITAIYECNDSCSCSPRCRNRVVQQGLKTRLQIFKTPKLGWGVRALHDIPKGTFICTYSGEVLDDVTCQKQAAIHGDDYIAALDYIETCESAKRDHEARPVEDLMDSDESNSPLRKGDKYQSISVPSFPSHSFSTSTRNNTHSSKGIKKLNSLRQCFNGKSSYSLDAKKIGNVGRFLNHSCSPNCFAQNVFVDTHDPRFPIVAFFAAEFIPAFTELTWDYNYEVGSVEGKKLNCYCESDNCRYRLI